MTSVPFWDVLFDVCKKKMSVCDISTSEVSFLAG